ncbi:uncharacterized protein PAC_06734 [Phialocephala subalpina]|uniref:FAD/NAD(P)-binding domain-containing protein n=1 Tax=Phialocephala subalpina TaxID=576137 RepID=A0A1L7WVP6_9HELO|nr:uncharacterized protein PAC_06734 [Phialocephala subalpina]
MKRVVIIGAGPCGLVALKEMLDGGHEAILFERSATLGGAFASAAMYPNLHLTISNWAMAFSDFPDSERLCYPLAEDYLRYLQRYAHHFDLERQISYSSELEEQTTLSMQADALIVATGANQVANHMPSGLSRFGGQILHSSEYGDCFKREVAEKGLRVLVVGCGESGADISAELGELSPNVTVYEVQQIAANKTQDFPANGFLEAATTNRMSAGQNVYAMCEALHEKKIEVQVCLTISARKQTCEFHMLDGTAQQRDFDAVVLCTGYRTEFPWIQLENFNPNPRSWFLHCFPEDLGHCLFFGGIPVMTEMLSRYIALLLHGERVLPLDYAAQARRDEEAEREYYFMNPNLSSLVDYNAFLESVARRLLWVATAAGFFLFENGLLLKWWFYPHWAIWYRQRGPGAVPTLPGAVLQRVNLWKATHITLGFVLLVLWSVPTFYAQRLPYVVLTALRLNFSKAWGGLLRPKLFALHGTQWRVSDLFLP